MIEREISIRTVGQTNRIEMISIRIYTICVYVYMRVDVWRVSMVQVRVNLCTINGWREERQRQKKKKSRRCCHPFLNMSFSYMCVSVSIRQFRRSHSLSISQLIIFNCSLVDRACESSLKINVYLFHSFLEFILIYRQLYGISQFIVIFSWANRTWQWPFIFFYEQY